MCGVQYKIVNSCILWAPDISSGPEISITMSNQKFIDFMVVRYGILSLYRHYNKDRRSYLGYVIPIFLQRLLNDEHWALSTRTAIIPTAVNILHILVSPDPEEWVKTADHNEDPVYVTGSRSSLPCSTMQAHSASTCPVWTGTCYCISFFLK